MSLNGEVASWVMLWGGSRTCGIKKRWHPWYPVLLISDFQTVNDESSGHAFQNLSLTLPTIQLSHWVTSLEAACRMKCSFHWSHKKVLYHLFFRHAAVHVKLVEIPFNNLVGKRHEQPITLLPIPALLPWSCGVVTFFCGGGCRLLSGLQRSYGAWAQAVARG